MWTVRGSPRSRAICSIRGTIAGSPHRCSSAAGKPSTARVKAYPRAASPRRCASSITATSTGRRTSAISTVHATCLDPATTLRSWPVTRLQVRPRPSGSAFSPSATSHASSRSGEQYTPDSARFNFCTAACVFPELVGPTCRWMARRIARAAGYHRPGSVMSRTMATSASGDASVGRNAVGSIERSAPKASASEPFRFAGARVAPPLRVPTGEDPPLSSRAAFFFLRHRALSAPFDAVVRARVPCVGTPRTFASASYAATASSTESNVPKVFCFCPPPEMRTDTRPLGRTVMPFSLGADAFSGPASRAPARVANHATRPDPKLHARVSRRAKSRSNHETREPADHGRDEAPRVEPAANLTAWRGAGPSEATVRSSARATSRRRHHIAASREPAGAHRL